MTKSAHTRASLLPYPIIAAAVAGDAEAVSREVAEQIYEKHRFFTDRLIEAGVDPVTAEKDACRMEHVISQESFERLRDAYKTKKE